MQTEKLQDIIKNITYMKETGKKPLTLKTLNKSTVWDIQENDVFRMLEAAEKDADLSDNFNHYVDVIRSAFEMEEVKVDRPEIIKKYEARDFKVGLVKVDDGRKVKYVIKKKAIMRVTDLTYENIRHITATKLVEVLERNFGGGWESLSQSIQDIIESAFDVTTTTLPKDRLHKKGGMYEKKVADGYEVLEISKGTWVEAIFAKLKPMEDKIPAPIEDDLDDLDNLPDDNDDEDLPEIEDEYGNTDDDDDDTFDEDRLTEESYRTTIDEDPEELSLEAEDVADDEY